MSRRTIESYEDLEVWQLAMDLAVLCYALTANFPRDETYGLTAQIKRASVSVPSNTAEGFGRDGTSSYIHFLRIALGSVRELEAQLLLSTRLKMATVEQASKARETAVRVSKMLRALFRRLEEKQS